MTTAAHKYPVKENQEYRPAPEGEEDEPSPSQPARQDLITTTDNPAIHYL